MHFENVDWLNIKCGGLFYLQEFWPQNVHLRTEWNGLFVRWFFWKGHPWGISLHISFLDSLRRGKSLFWAINGNVKRLQRDRGEVQMKTSLEMNPDVQQHLHFYSDTHFVSVLSKKEMLFQWHNGFRKELLSLINDQKRTFKVMCWEI